MTQCGSINHYWNQVQVEYTLGVQFPSPNTDKKKKALLLGAAFLLVIFKILCCNYENIFFLGIHVFRSLQKWRLRMRLLK